MAKQIDDAQIFEATVDVLLANGYAGATTKLIAEAADVNEVTLFRKYGSKAELVATAVLHERQSLEIESTTYTGDLAADMLAIVEAYTHASYRQSSLIMLILADMTRYPELGAVMQVPLMLVSHFGNIIARYQEEGRLRAEEPLLIVGALLGPVIVNRMLHTAAPDLPVPEIDAAKHVEQFLHGYAM